MAVACLDSDERGANTVRTPSGVQQMLVITAAVRVMTDARGEPWFVAVDVCAALDVAEAHRALSRLDGDEKGRHSVTTPGGAQEMSIVNESGLYSLILGSDEKGVASTASLGAGRPGRRREGCEFSSHPWRR